MGLVLKLLFLAGVLLLSYHLVELLLLVPSLALDLAGVHSASGTLFDGLLGMLLTVVVAACVGVFFTIPALLSMFGHAGAWVKHVVSRSAKTLAAALGLAFVFYLAGSLPLLGSDNFDALPQADFVFILFPAVLFVLLLFFRGPLVGVMSRAGRFSQESPRSGKSTYKCGTTVEKG